MTYFIRNGNSFSVMADGSIDISQVLEPNTYVVRIDATGNLYLELIKSFELPSKLYGDLSSVGARILKTYENRTNNTGVLLVGEKGSGKTLLAKYLSIEAQKKGVPTILVNQCFNGEALNSLLSKIEQTAVVLFDEFEKNYPGGGYCDETNSSDNKQERLLTLLDGVYNTKKLFVLTCNNREEIDEHLINRPGRIYYYKDFTGLDMSFVEEYVNDRLDKSVSSKFKNELLYRIRLIGTVNFDMLQAIVEESNRYPDNVSFIFNMLNVGLASSNTYIVNVKPVGYDEYFELNKLKDPLHSKDIVITLNSWFRDSENKISEQRERDKLPLAFVFNNDHITGVDKDGSISFTNDVGDEMLLSRMKVFSGGPMAFKYRG